MKSTTPAFRVLPKSHLRELIEFEGTCPWTYYSTYEDSHIKKFDIKLYNNDDNDAYILSLPFNGSSTSRMVELVFL
jgi:hypothetical protein